MTNPATLRERAAQAGYRWTMENQDQICECCGQKIDWNQYRYKLDETRVHGTCLEAMWELASLRAELAALKEVKP